MKPVIGIVLQNFDDDFRKMHINKEICYSISKYGAIVFGIYPDIDKINEVLKVCDGFILQGGDNFTDYDLKLINKIYYLNKPILGICQGMQTLSYWANGKIKKIENSNHKQKNKKYVHEINIIKGTKLYDILNKSKIFVNSRHGQCVEYTNMIISSISNDGIIESIELPNRKFFLGVQWHPESLIDDINSRLIFESFINSCKGDINETF